MSDWVFCNSTVPNSFQIDGSDMSSSFSNKSPVIAKQIGFACFLVSTRTVTSSDVWPGVVTTLTSGQILYSSVFEIIIVFIYQVNQL